MQHKLGLLPHTIYKNELKWYKVQNGRVKKCLKALKENRSINLGVLELGNGFLATTPKAHATKEKTEKLDFIDYKLCASHDTIKK